MSNRKTNPYQTDGIECIIRMIVPKGTAVERFPAIQALSILLVYELNPIIAHRYGIDPLIEKLLGEALGEVKACQRRLNDDENEPPPNYTILRDIELEDGLPESANEECFFIHLEHDWKEGCDRIFLLGRTGPGDFLLNDDDVHFVRIYAQAFPRAASIPIDTEGHLTKLLTASSAPMGG